MSSRSWPTLRIGQNERPLALKSQFFVLACPRPKPLHAPTMPAQSIEGAIRAGSRHSKPLVALLRPNAPDAPPGDDGHPVLLKTALRWTDLPAAGRRSQAQAVSSGDREVRQV